MIRHCLTLAVLFACFVGAAFAAEPSPQGAQKVGTLDLVPTDVVAAIAIRNVAELTKRGDALIDKAELKVPMRLSEGYRFVVSFLGIHRGLDDEGAAALMAFKTQFDEETLVLAVPVADVPAMAGNFKLTEKELASGKIIDRRAHADTDVLEFVRYIVLRGSHLYMGGSRKSIESASQGKRLRQSLDERDRASLAADDFLLYANRKELGEFWSGFMSGLENELKALEADESQPLRKVGAAANELQSIVAGMRLEEGLGATLVLQFAGDKSRAILTQLQGGTARSSLAGLPRGRVLAAHASSGDGDASAALVRSLLLTKFPWHEQLFISEVQRPKVVGVFGELWQRLEGSRVALYENEQPDRDGHFSLVAILDTEDAERFVNDMTSLTRFVNSATLSADEADATIDAKTIADLVTQLGHDEYRTRQMAATKLGLIGTPALPALEKALQSKDPEVQLRAQGLLEQINAVVAAQRDDLLNRDLLTRIKPTFAYFPKQETRSGQPVAIVQMKLRAEEAEYAPQLRRFLGPQWSKLRLATIGKQVVVLLGSDTKLLEQAIANVKSADRALAADDRLALFQARVPAERTAEFHLRLNRSLAFATAIASPKPADDAATATTSLGVAVAPQRLRLDLFAPVDEIKSVATQANW